MIDLTAPVITGGCRSPLVVPDAEASMGLALRYTGADELPLPIGIWNCVTVAPDLDRAMKDYLRKEQAGQYEDYPGVCRVVRAKDIPGKGYHLYRGPRFKLSEWTHTFITKPWNIQEHLWSLFDPVRPLQEWDLHVSAKFTGPACPHGDPKEPNALFIDRILLTREER
ncbi:MAG: hypothetical protein HY360_03605 [Verrucomicrobia bacterium]|nr:hypothetical protein [Verrucomicrobiota bacterium]